MKCRTDKELKNKNKNSQRSKFVTVGLGDAGRLLIPSALLHIGSTDIDDHVLLLI